ncbi:uncharacterized protein LOC142419245 [Mycteria americana]|uniref:uncharacterized protein LOC142419245 n=1 Tax=Mycteria americana TaxID=33587 RepID=UPI003F587D55
MAMQRGRPAGIGPQLGLPLPVFFYPPISQKRELLPIRCEAETCIGPLLGHGPARRPGAHGPNSASLRGGACRGRRPREAAGRILSLREALRPGTAGPTGRAGAADGAPSELVDGKPSSRDAALVSALQPGEEHEQYGTSSTQPHIKEMICLFISASTMLQVLQGPQDEAAAQQPPANCSEPVTYQAVAFKKICLQRTDSGSFSRAPSKSKVCLAVSTLINTCTLAVVKFLSSAKKRHQRRLARRYAEQRCDEPWGAPASASPALAACKSAHGLLLWFGAFQFPGAGL